MSHIDSLVMARTLRTEPQPGCTVRLLRCRRTNRYFCEGGWTEDATQAKAFMDEMDAVRACLNHSLEEVELVLREPGSDVDLFSTPVR
jgi:hypothetical protein